MNKSSRIFLTYSVAALLAVVGVSVLTYQAWEWRPRSDTLEYELRLVALAVLPLLGLSLIVQIVGDPLAWRVMRMLRRRERLAGGLSI